MKFRERNNETSSSHPFLVRRLRKTYGEKVVVSDLSFHIEKGEVVGLLGPNGAGKTTTFRILYGAAIPDQGEVTICGIDFFSDPSGAKAKMAILPQEDNLDESFSLLDNLIHFGRYCGLSTREGEKKGEQLLERLSISEWKHNKPNEVSGGVVRRGMLARSLLVDPEVILFDEPTTGLDPHVRQDFWALVLELKKEGKAILLTTHYMDEASRLCDRLILLQKGEIVGEGAPKEIVSEVIGDEVVEIIGPSHEGISQALGDTDIWIANFSDGYLIALPRGDADLILERLLQLPHKQYTRRASNLDDVFIRLTGGKLTGLRQDFVL